MGSCHFLIPWTLSNLWSATIYVLGIINRTLGLNFNLTSRPPLGDISPRSVALIYVVNVTERDLWVRYFQESNGQIVFFFFNCLLRCCPLSQLTAVSYGHFLSLPPPPFSLSSCFFPFIVNISITLPRFRSATRVILTTICIYSENQSVAQKDKFHPSLVELQMLA